MTQLLFDDFVSEEFVVDAGLDQRDLFSPMEYLLYNSDHLAIADPKNGEHWHVFVFIDDTTLVVVGDSFKETHEKLGHLMEKENGIFAWATKHNCAFGTNKFLDLLRRREPDLDNPRKHRSIMRTPLNLRGLEIPSRLCIKLLGVEIDNELRWKQQGAVAIKKGQDWLIQFSRLSQVLKGIATKYMRQLYMAVVIPRMLYAADVFLPPVAIDPRQREEGKRRGGQVTLGKLALI